MGPLPNSLNGLKIGVTNYLHKILQVLGCLVGSDRNWFVSKLVYNSPIYGTYPAYFYIFFFGHPITSSTSKTSQYILYICERKGARFFRSDWGYLKAPFIGESDLELPGFRETHILVFIVYLDDGWNYILPVVSGFEPLYSATALCGTTGIFIHILLISFIYIYICRVFVSESFPCCFWVCGNVVYHERLWSQRGKILIGIGKGDLNKLCHQP